MEQADHYQRVYAEQAEAYDRMVEAEDADARLGPALVGLGAAPGAVVVDVGAGSGRLSRLLSSAGARVVAVEPARAMLSVARRRGGGALLCVQGDALRVPVADAVAELAVAGWVFGHFTSWHLDDWRSRVDRAVAELSRVTRRGGNVAVFETLGTGTDAAGPPNERLAAYYRRLEAVHGFRRETLSTDYAFSSPEAAAASCRFFFGDALADRIVERRWARVPEWTGLWWRAR